MNKFHILKEIKRTAEDNNGEPLGIRTFFKETGIKESDWKGKYWTRWGDAIQEAGFTPNQLTQAYSDQHLMTKLIEFTRTLGRFPTIPDIRLKTRSDKSFPNDSTFRKYGSKFALISKVIEYCRSHEGYEDIVQICLPLLSTNGKENVDKDNLIDDEVQLGFVYLIKSGKHFKIGRSNAAGRREYELAIQLPDKAETIHKIQTDDPSGIEFYWHRRFADKRKNGEWFDLSASDVKAFRRRKFM